MSNHTNLYIHVYTELQSDIIAYANPEETCDIGQYLLDFIYTDLSALSSYEKNRNDQIIFLKQIHPYFRHVPEESLKKFFQNSIDKGYTDNYSVEGLLKLQVLYKDWLMTYVQEGFSENFIQKTGNYRFYSQSHYVALNNQPAIDHFLLGFEDCLYLEFSEIVNRQIRIKNCKNCFRMFLPQKSNVDYCSRIYTADGKSCQDVGYTQTFARSVKNDELLQAYTRAYKAHYARMSKPRKRAGNLSREDFEKWYHEAKDKLNLARNGILDAQEYKEWLKK